MNVKKLTVLSGGALALLISSGASAQITMGWEEVSNTGSSDVGRTYRLYALMNEGDELEAVYGNQDTELSVTSTGSFYHNAFQTGFLSAGVNAALFTAFPDLEYTSFMTIGSLDSAGDETQSIGIDAASFIAGGPLTADNGTIFAIPGSPQLEAQAVSGLKDSAGNVIAPGWGVLVAQLSVVNGGPDFAGVMSAGFQGTRASDGSIFQEAASITFGGGVIPAPGALALLGLAGLAGRRRRR